MGQERLSGLAVISINAEVALDDLISDFAARKTCTFVKPPEAAENAYAI